MTIPLQDSIVYGPVDSRRFGRSLGINLLPADRKTCNFDCVYCQYGPRRGVARAPFPSVGRIAEELRRYLAQHSGPFDWLMICGNGEPTLHPEFAEAVEAVLEVRDELLSFVPVGILSNSSMCWKPEVKKALLRLDGCFLKLDAGDGNVFRRLNRPKGRQKPSAIIESLADMPNVVIQSMFVKGPHGNITLAAQREWIKAIAAIHPESVQIYTVDRPTAERGVKAVPVEQLAQIAARLQKATGIRPAVFAA